MTATESYTSNLNVNTGILIKIEQGNQQKSQKNNKYHL